MPSPANSETQTIASAPRRAFLSALFFCSGALALVYEVLWHRQFSLLFGSAAPAAAVVLAAYFAGLGVGSFVFGKLADRWRNPLRVYGMLELGVGAGALMVTPLLSLVSAAYPSLDLRLSDRAELFLAVKGFFAFLAIAIPTVAMGGTLPILAELFDVRKEQPGLRVGWLYAVNTAGAALGALAFPFLLLPNLGLQKTTYVCAGMNFLIAAGAFWLAKAPAGIARPPVQRARKIGTSGLPRPLILAFISGAGTFALQVLWNRAFAQIHENSIFSFALIVTVFIVAIAAGAEVARMLLKRGVNVRRGLGGLWMAGGLLTLVAPQLFLGLSRNLEYLGSDFSVRLLVLATGVIFVPIALLAAGMPMLFEGAAISSKRSIGNSTGSLLTTNIGGSVTGALLAGFVFPGTLGMWKTTAAVGLVFFVAASWVLFRKTGTRLVATGIAALLGWFAFSQDLPRTRADATNGETLLGITEGAHGVVAVTERGASRRLKLNNHYVLGGTSAIGDERMQAHIPILLGGAGGTAAFLGYGTGITAGGALFHPGLQSTGVELVKEVSSFAGRYFAEANAGFGSSQSSRLIIEDARNFLRASGRGFDVIVGDLVVPWRPGEAGLYTREHFAAAKASLNANGLFCVWVPAFQVTETEFKIILNTFFAEFGRALIWRGDFSPTEAAIALMGFRNEERSLDFAAVSARLAHMTPDPFNPQLKFPAAFWMHLIGVMGRDDLDPSEMRINREDVPWLELRGLGTKNPMEKAAYVGRDLQMWESRTRERSRTLLALPPEAAAGWEAGSLMAEFTLLLSEGRRAEADAVRLRIEPLLGGDAYTAIFGGAR